jgi:hypothetical protein
MTLVPGGSFIMGKSDDDLGNVQDATKNSNVFILHGRKRKLQQRECQFVEG